MGNSNASEIQIARCQKFKSLKAIGDKTIIQSRLISEEKITVQYGTAVKVGGKVMAVPEDEPAKEYSQAEGGMLPLVKEAAIDPEQFKDRFPLWKGESRKSRERRKKYDNKLHYGIQVSGVTIQVSGVSFSDSNILNCDKRFVDNSVVEEEVGLWELAKNIGVQCVSDEESIHKKFREMKARDQQLYRITAEERDDCGP